MTQAVRNIGVIAHIDAGKTTLSERMLFYTRKIHRMGEVHDGHGHHGLPARGTRAGHHHHLGLHDLRMGTERPSTSSIRPATLNFTIEVERSLRVLDGAVGVFCAVGRRGAAIGNGLAAVGTLRRAEARLRQ